jgi:DNA-binding transcriptional LysR family regulator
MEFDQLRTLVSVLDHRSFTRAAEALGLSQSTVSFQIKALETALDVRLVDRGRDGVQATVHGRLIRRYAERMLALREEALTALHAHAQGVMGRVTVAASTIPGEYLLPLALAELRRSHPGVDVSITVHDSRRALASLLAEECELALVGARPKDRRVTLRPFASDEVMLVGPVPNPFALAPDGSLAGVPLVLRQEGSGTRDAIADVLARSRGLGEDAAAIVEVGSTEAAKRAVLAGLGLAFVSRHAVTDDLVAGRLQEVELAGLPVRRRFFVATRRSATLSPAASALCSILCERDW